MLLSPVRATATFILLLFDKFSANPHLSKDLWHLKTVHPHPKSRLPPASPFQGHLLRMDKSRFSTLKGHPN